MTLTEVQKRAQDAVDAIALDLIRLSKEIHSHPELAWEEHYAYAQLVPFVKEHGFEVTEHAYTVGYGEGTGAGFGGGKKGGKIRFIRLQYDGGDWDQEFGIPRAWLFGN